jgi:hypothetical protein
MSDNIQSEASAAGSDESASLEPSPTASSDMDLIDDISNATGRTPNEVESALLNLLPERLPNQSDSSLPETGP